MCVFFYNAVPALWDFTCYVLHLIRAFKGFSSVLLGVFLKQTIIIIIPISTYLNGNQNPTFTLTWSRRRNTHGTMFYSLMRFNNKKKGTVVHLCQCVGYGCETMCVLWVMHALCPVIWWFSLLSNSVFLLSMPLHCIFFKHVTLVHILDSWECRFLSLSLSLSRLYKGLCDFFFCCQTSTSASMVRWLVWESQAPCLTGSLLEGCSNGFKSSSTDAVAKFMFFSFFHVHLYFSKRKKMIKQRHV